MKKHFNYSGFCRSAYSFKSKKSSHTNSGDHGKEPQENPARRIPPYMEQFPVNRHLKCDE